MNKKEKDSKEETKEERYDWRGNVAVYSNDMVGTYDLLNLERNN